MATRTRSRRRTHADGPSHTVSFTFSRATADALRDLAEEGVIDNASAFVEDAVRARLKELWWRRREEEYARAAADPEFMADVEETGSDFEEADAEALRDLRDDC